MGHERVGYLPKSQKWKSIVEKIKDFSTSNDNVVDIATETTKNVRSRFNNIEQDGGVVNAFKFLVLLVHASKLSDPNSFLKSNGIVLSKDFSVFQLVKSAQDYIAPHQDSKEYSTFAYQSMMDTIGEWSLKNQVQQTLIFDGNKNPFDIWTKAANGAGFCELSRTFFGKVTERYLKYFLERELSSKVKTLYDREQFVKKLETHVNEVSKHAFETAKIAQSYAAGWYNNNAKSDAPTESAIKGFLSFAFKKISSELLREENR